MNKKGENSPADPCVMVIFGAFGDLTKRKLIPTLYNLTRDGFLSNNFSVVGVARRELDSAKFREKLDQDMEGEV
ncbi:MAG: glucose-6-phosphate dehydrogenase, partial [Acidobacteriota bacterium]